MINLDKELFPKKEKNKRKVNQQVCSNVFIKHNRKCSSKFSFSVGGSRFFRMLFSSSLPPVVGFSFFKLMVWL